MKLVLMTMLILYIYASCFWNTGAPWILGALGLSLLFYTLKLSRK